MILRGEDVTGRRSREALVQGGAAVLGKYAAPGHNHTSVASNEEGSDVRLLGVTRGDDPHIVSGIIREKKSLLVKASDLYFKLCSKLWECPLRLLTPGTGNTICPSVRRQLLTAVGSHMAVRGGFTHSLLAPDVSCIRDERRRNSRSKCATG